MSVEARKHVFSSKAIVSPPLAMYERHDGAVDRDKNPRASVELGVDPFPLGEHCDGTVAVVVDVAKTGGKQCGRRVDQPYDRQVPRLTIA